MFVLTSSFILADTNNCADADAECPSWATDGECSRNPEYMHAECRKSCGLCRPRTAPPRPASGPVDVEGELLYSYVPWEQMTKQKKGIMWALETARSVRRTLVVPPFRFHTDVKDVYEYHPVSTFLDLEPLRQLHPLVELHEYLAAADGKVDALFALRRGMPAVKTEGDWVDGECNAKDGTADVVHDTEMACAVDAQGEEACWTPVTFGGSPASVANVSCGWAPTMQWSRILKDARRLRSVAIGSIVYQMPMPGKPHARLAELQRDADAGIATCGWRCAALAIRQSMVPRAGFLQEARRFLQRAKERAAAAEEAASTDEPRVLGVHWRRGDFLAKRGSTERVCDDDATGEPLGKCIHVPVVRSPDDLAGVIRERMRVHNCSLVFLATNADAGEVAQLQDSLPSVELVRYTDEPPADLGGGRGALAVLDSLVCALTDAFIGSRRSMFSENILEERALRGHGLRTGYYMP